MCVGGERIRVFMTHCERMPVTAKGCLRVAEGEDADYAKDSKIVWRERLVRDGEEQSE